MAFPKGHPRYGGRVAGQQNKLTKTVKESFGEAFELLGGAQALYLWAKHNQTDFYKIASKLIPADVNLAVEQIPQANVFPNVIEPDERLELSASPEAVDSLH